MLCDSISLLWSQSLCHLTSVFGLLLCDSSAMALIFIIQACSDCAISMSPTSKNNKDLKLRLYVLHLLWTATILQWLLWSTTMLHQLHRLAAIHWRWLCSAAMHQQLLRSTTMHQRLLRLASMHRWWLQLDATHQQWFCSATMHWWWICSAAMHWRLLRLTTMHWRTHLQRNLPHPVTYSGAWKYISCVITLDGLCFANHGCDGRGICWPSYSSSFSWEEGLECATTSSVVVHQYGGREKVHWTNGDNETKRRQKLTLFSFIWSWFLSLIIVDVAWSQTAVEAAEDVVCGAAVRDLSEVRDVIATLILASSSGC